MTGPEVIAHFALCPASYRFCQFCGSGFESMVPVPARISKPAVVNKLPTQHVDDLVCSTGTGSKERPPQFAASFISRQACNVAPLG
jgi:hypothetical protein